MFFVVFSFGPSCFLNDLQDSHLHRTANRWCIDAVWLNRCHTWEVPCTNVPIVDTTFPGGKKTAATPQVRVDTPTKPHEAASPKMDDGQGLVGLEKWFSNKTYKKRIQGWWKSFWVFRVLCLRLAENGLVALCWGSAFWGWQILCLSSWSQVYKRYETWPLIMTLDVAHLSGQGHHQHWWANHMEINTCNYCTRNGHETRLLKVLGPKHVSCSSFLVQIS